MSLLSLLWCPPVCAFAFLLSLLSLSLSLSVVTFSCDGALALSLSACGKDSYSKQLTAAGFVLKGGGWYVTDFKDQKGKGQDKKQNMQGEKKSGDDSTGKGKNHGENSATTKDNGDKKSVAAEKKNPVKENKVKTTHGSEKR